MSEASINKFVQILHRDLASRYRQHASKVENLWRSFDTRRRIECLKAGAAEMVVLKDSSNESMGRVNLIIPEWNSHEVAESGPDFLLSLLKYRATTSLFEQYIGVIDGSNGDHTFIDKMIRNEGLSHVESFKDCCTFFFDDEDYGESFKIEPNHPEILTNLKPAIQACTCIPQSTGELVLQRQIHLLQSLVIIIENILDKPLEEGNSIERPKRCEIAEKATVSKSINPSQTKLGFQHLIASARDQQSLSDEYLSLLCTEPAALTYAVNISFYSRPELVPDEKGRRLPAHTDRYISAAFFEVMQAVNQNTATWKYVCCLLDILASSATEKLLRASILQELSNICYMEYSRKQALFKRHVQSGIGSKWFQRISNTYEDNGNTRVKMKGKPEVHTRDDPQLHYILRLCQPSVDASLAIEWLRKLGNLHEAHETEREKLQEREADSLCDLVDVVGFIEDLSGVLRVPRPSRQKGQLFISRSRELESKLSQLRTEIDLGDYVVPINNLMETQVFGDALKAFENFMVEKTCQKTASGLAAS